MFCWTPVMRLGCSSITIKHVFRVMKRNYIPPSCKCQNFLQVNACNLYRLHQYSTTQNKEVKVSENTGNAPEVTTFEAIKENTKTAWYGGVVVVGLGIGATIFYILFKELFSSNSPNNVYSKALTRCLENEKVIFHLGDPVEVYGKGHRRRRSFSHLLYEKDGVTYMRMKFRIKGSRKMGTVHLEVKENESGDYEYRYLFVQIDDYTRNTVILEDNRSKTTLTPLTPLNEIPTLM